jgi:hypothetical protein
MSACSAINYTRLCGTLQRHDICGNPPRRHDNVAVLEFHEAANRAIWVTEAIVDGSALWMPTDEDAGGVFFGYPQRFHFVGIFKLRGKCVRVEAGGRLGFLRPTLRPSVELLLPGVAPIALPRVAGISRTQAFIRLQQVWVDSGV